MVSTLKVLIFFIALTVKVSDTENVFEDADKKPTEMESFRQILGALSRQVMLQQLFIEERIRSEGDSGVKQVRLSREGTRNYYTENHGSIGRVLAIHDHSNNERTVGLGEFIAVLNGVEFRTRHNDYRLYMASKTSKDYHATEEIPFPEVPPEVKNKATVDEQIVEMREWFKAWKLQDHSVRDYRKYFKPVLCFLEGAWTTATKDIDEPFESDRHFIDAKSWFDLQEKVRFTSYTGRKDNLENFSFLPTSIMEIINGTIPLFAQWNYRILCHPLSRDVPLNRFRVIDEFHSRLPARRKYEEQANTRGARFQLNPSDTDKWKEGINNPRFTFLDELMSEIPGKDNYKGNLTDEAFDMPAHTADPKKSGKLNTAYYHRWFKVMEKDAMGQSVRHRGFADKNLFMAMTTQPKVARFHLTDCQKERNWTKPQCNPIAETWTWGIPLEIVYMTPLSSWNPYGLKRKGSEKTKLGKTVFQGGRNGEKTLDKAFNGTNSVTYYLTPSRFFSGEEVSTDAADTTRGSVGVLDRNGVVRITRASGTRIFIPEIHGVGVLRQRYPIMPVHGEGSSVWKELEATKDLLMKSKTYGYMYREPLVGSGVLPTAPPDKPVTLKMEDATRTPPGAHTHEITLTSAEVTNAKTRKESFTKLTSPGAGHQHNIQVMWRKNRWVIKRCDQHDKGQHRCLDRHGMYLHKEPTV